MDFEITISCSRKRTEGELVGMEILMARAEHDPRAPTSDLTLKTKVLFYIIHFPEKAD